MRSILLLSAFIVAVQLPSTLGLLKAPIGRGACDPQSFSKVTVDLDLPPEERFRDVALAYRHSSIPLALRAKRNLDKYFTSSQQDDWYRAIVATMTDHPEWMTELRSIVKYTDHPAVTLRSQVLFMAIYEMGSKTGCSGLLAAMPNGTVVHGRNMDYELISPVGEITFLRKGLPFMTGTNYLGGIGFSTMMRVGGWSFEQNTRKYADESDDVRVQRNLQSLKDGGLLHNLAARQVMEEVGDFSTAVQRLTELKMASPQYFIMAGSGPYEGAVIDVDRFGHHMPFNNVQVLSREIGRWYLLQTNDDLPYAPKDLRRPMALAKLGSSTQEEMSMDGVEAMMRSFPLYTPGNVFTWVATPATGAQRTLMGSNGCGNPLAES